MRSAFSFWLLPAAGYSIERIPLVNIVIARNFGAILAVGIAFIAAYLGVAAHHLLHRATTQRTARKP